MGTNRLLEGSIDLGIFGFFKIASAARSLPDPVRPRLVTSGLDRLATMFGAEDAASFLPVAEEIASYRAFGRAPLCASMEELGKHPELFEYADASASPEETGKPKVIVFDNFYDNPFAIRDIALKAKYFDYAPTWFCSSKLEVSDENFLLNDTAIRERLATVCGSKIDASEDVWAKRPWNGGFHYKTRERLNLSCSIHSHQPDDIKDGWNAIVYLNPPGTYPAGSGVSVWRNRKTGKCVTRQKLFENRLSDFDLVLSIENAFNRLVLMRGDVYHMGERGFGTTRDDARLFQTFFFEQEALVT